MEPIEKMVTYREKVYQEIKEAIIAGKFIDEIINERQLSRQLKVSRTPVREALQMLKLEGWVTIEPWKGIYVKPLTPKQMKDVYFVREIIEVNALPVAIKNLTKHDIAQLYDLLEEMKNQDLLNHPLDFARTDLSFHSKIIQLADNEILTRWMGSLSDMLQRITVLTMKFEGRHKDSLLEHKNILVALEEKNYERAKAELKRHLDRGSRDLMQKLIRQCAQDTQERPEETDISPKE